MGQSVYNLWIPLCDFLWGLASCATRWEDRNPQQSLDLMIHPTIFMNFVCDQVGLSRVISLSID